MMKLKILSIVVHYIDETAKCIRKDTHQYVWNNFKSGTLCRKTFASKKELKEFAFEKMGVTDNCGYELNAHVEVRTFRGTYHFWN